MSNMMKGLALVLGAGAIAAIASNTGDGFTHREVAGHEFEIPSDYLFLASIPWLPSPENNSFFFLFEPNATPDQIPKHIVLVEQLSRYCPGDASQMLRIACGLEHASGGDGELRFEEVPDELTQYSSDVFAVRGTEQRQVAFCRTFGPNPARPKGGKTCTTFWAHGDLMLQFSFDFSELPELASMKQHATRMLDSWRLS